MIKIKYIISISLFFFISSCIFENTPPVIMDQSFIVRECLSNDTELDTIKATDVNKNQKLNFSIISGNFKNAFRIDSASGVLYINNTNAIDFEEFSTFELGVQVKDNGRQALTSCAKVTIFVSDFIETPLDGLVAYYPFNGNANDHSGNNRNGDNYGARLTTDRYNRPNSAFEFNGINTYINTLYTFDFEYRTLSLWIYPYVITGRSPHNSVFIVQDSPTLKYGLFGGAIEEGVLELHAGGSGYDCFKLPKEKLLKKWLHIVMVRKGDVSLYYINGELAGTSCSNTKSSTWDTNPNLIIGAGRSLSYQFFNGKIDDVAVFNRALTEQEIALLYKTK